MFIPLRDENALKTIDFQYMTVALIALNIVVYLLFPAGTDIGVIASFGVVPNELLASVGYQPAVAPDSGAFAIPESYTLISYMFFHADLLHLAGNMLFLWVFGDNVEDAVGHFKFLFFFLLCGIAAAFAHALIAPGSGIPLIGASGAVSGVVAAYLILHPRVQVWVLALPVIPLKITAALALGGWILYQFAMAFMQYDGHVAWWAHIGGLIAGALLIFMFKRPDVKLFS